jgi:hypothetical protein
VHSSVNLAAPAKTTQIDLEQGNCTAPLFPFPFLRSPVVPPFYQNRLGDSFGPMGITVNCEGSDRNEHRGTATQSSLQVHTAA